MPWIDRAVTEPRGETFPTRTWIVVRHTRTRQPLRAFFCQGAWFCEGQCTPVPFDAWRPLAEGDADGKE